MMPRLNLIKTVRLHTPRSPIGEGGTEASVWSSQTAGIDQSGWTRRRPRGAIGLLAVAGLFLLSGCAEEPWNNPYSESQSGENILYSAFSERPRTLDPAKSYSSNEVEFTGQIYEPPLQYHYLKRPYELEPLTAARMPEPVYLAADGTRLPMDAPVETIARSVYEIEIRPGIFYQPHPAFARDDDGDLAYHALGQEELASIRNLDDFPLRGTRELVAADYVNQIKRLADPRLQSPILGLMGEYIVGLREYAGTLQAAYQAQGARGLLDLSRFPLEGVQVVDRYTYRILVDGKYPQLKYWLAMPFFAAVPPEVERFYAQPGMNERNLNMDWYPVGTGPYMLTENNPNRRMVLERNPNYRADPYPSEGEPEDSARGLLRDAGRDMPFIDKVVFSLEKESIPAWSKFLQGYYDTSGIASDSFDQAVQFGSGGEAELTPEMRERGIELLTEVQATTFYNGFNMLDPVVGGYSEQARKLRQAISIAIDYEDYISIFLNGRGTAAQGPLPPGIGPEGEDPQINPYVYRLENGQAVRRSIEDAKQLLVEAGYPNGRDMRTGEPLLIHLDVTGGGPEDKARFDWLRKQFRRIDLELIIRNTDYNRFQEKMRKGNAQLFTWGWNADYPDAENFMFLLYGPNGKAEFGGENAANYDSPEFNRLFERMANMEDSPERAAIIEEMLEVARRDAPWIWGFHPKRFVLHHTWYHNAKLHLMANNTLKYRRIDPGVRAELRAEWNQPVVGPLALVGVLLLLTLVPALHMYRRKERQPAIREPERDPGALRVSEEDPALDARQRRQQY